MLPIEYNSHAPYTLQMAIRLSLQRALLFEVASNLRSVRVDWDNEKKMIMLYFYFDGKISLENRDSASCIAGEVAGDFNEDTQVIEHCIQLDYPASIPTHSCNVYTRKEDM